MAAIGATPAFANTDPLSELLTAPGSAALGLTVRAEQSQYGGGGTRCDLLPISTRIAGVKIGKPFNDQLNGWPLNIVGYGGVLPHDCRGLAPKGLQLDAFMKTYYTVFPEVSGLTPGWVWAWHLADAAGALYRVQKPGRTWPPEIAPAQPPKAEY